VNTNVMNQSNVVSYNIQSVRQQMAATGTSTARQMYPAQYAPPRAVAQMRKNPNAQLTGEYFRHPHAYVDLQRQGNMNNGNRPRQALSFIPAPVALQPLQQVQLVPQQQYSYVPPGPRPQGNGNHAQQQPAGLFGGPAHNIFVRPLTQTYSYVPPPTKSLMDESQPQKTKEQEMSWSGITVEDGRLCVHGSKADLEKFKQHPLMCTLPVTFVEMEDGQRKRRLSNNSGNSPMHNGEGSVSQSGSDGHSRHVLSNITTSKSNGSAVVNSEELNSRVNGIHYDDPPTAGASFTIHQDAMSPVARTSVTSMRVGVDEPRPLPPRGVPRVVFIDPEGLLNRGGPTNDYGLNEKEVDKLKKLMHLLGESTTCVLTPNGHLRESGGADTFYQGLKEAGIRMVGHTPHVELSLNLPLVGPNAIDKTLYMTLQMKATRCREVAKWISSNPTVEWVLMQPWGGDEVYGCIPPSMEDPNIQPWLVQCTDGVDIAGALRTFSKHMQNSP